MDTISDPGRTSFIIFAMIRPGHAIDMELFCRVDLADQRQLRDPVLSLRISEHRPRRHQQPQCDMCSASQVNYCLR